MMYRTSLLLLLSMLIAQQQEAMAAAQVRGKTSNSGNSNKNTGATDDLQDENHDNSFLRRNLGGRGMKDKKIIVTFPGTPEPTPEPTPAPVTPEPTESPDAGRGDNSPVPVNPFAGEESCLDNTEVGVLAGELACRTFSDCAEVDDNGAAAGFSCCIWPACRCRPAVPPGRFADSCTRDEIFIPPVAPVTPAPVTPAPVTAAPVVPTPVTAAPVTAAPVVDAGRDGDDGQPVTPIGDDTDDAPYNPFAGSAMCETKGNLPGEIGCSSFADCVGVDDPGAVSGFTCCMAPTCTCRPAVPVGTFFGAECTAN